MGRSTETQNTRCKPPPAPLNTRGSGGWGGHRPGEGGNRLQTNSSPLRPQQQVPGGCSEMGKVKCSREVGGRESLLPVPPGRDASAPRVRRAPQMEGFHPKGSDSDGVEGGIPTLRHHLVLTLLFPASRDRKHYTGVWGVGSGGPKSTCF